MNTTVESLQALYVKLGGSIEDVADKTTIPEMLDAITLISGTDKPEIDGISINGGAVVTPDENGIIDLTIGDGSTAIDPELSPTSTNPVQNKIVTGEINSLNESVTALNGSLGTYAVGKNLVGAENGKLYPVYLPQSGMKITVSSISDDPSASAYLNLFDADGVYITYYNIKKDMLPRTLTINHSGELFMCITNSSHDAQINSGIYQAEFGSEATEYEEYFSNAKGLSEKAESFVTNKLTGIVFEQGTLISGVECYSYTLIKNRLRSNRFKILNSLKVTPKEGYQFYYMRFVDGTVTPSGWRTEPAILNDSECEYRIGVASIDGSNVGFGHINDYVTIDFDTSPLHGKNLVGQESGVLYPIDLVKNEKLTMSTKDGTPVNGYVQFNFFDENKEYVNYYMFTRGLSVRTVPWNSVIPIKYVSMITDEGGTNAPIQLEYGDTATSFADYVNLDAVKNTDIRDYYYDEMMQTVNSSKSLMSEPCLVFPIITDIHYRSETNVNLSLILDSANNIEHFLKKVRCDFVLNLGDNTDGNVDKDFTKGRNSIVVNRLAGLGIPYYQALGNHDTNYYASEKLTMADIYASYFSATKDVKFNPDTNGTEYYIDYPTVGVRIVVLNVNYGEGGRYAYSPTTANWLTNNALQTDNIVLLCEHLSSVPTQNWENRKPTNADSITSAVQAFVNNGGTVIQLCGHSHADYAFDTPWLTVFSCCNKCQQVDVEGEGYAVITGYTEAPYAPERVVGTVSEDCWSIGILRPTARKLNLIRFGAGEDREYTF